MGKRRLLLLTSGCLDVLTAKTAVTLLRYCPDEVVAVLDAERAGFEWIDCSDADRSVLSLLRHDGAGDTVAAVFNFTPVPRDDERVGVPWGGTWIVRVDTDAPCAGLESALAWLPDADGEYSEARGRRVRDGASSVNFLAANFIRAFGDDQYYPDTLCPPANKNWYITRLKTARQYGMNASKGCVETLPQEYIEAADEGHSLAKPMNLMYVGSATLAFAERHLLED